MITAAVYLTVLYLGLDPNGWMYFLLVLFDLVLLDFIENKGKKND